MYGGCCCATFRYKSSGLNDKWFLTYSDAEFLSIFYDKILSSYDGLWLSLTPSVCGNHPTMDSSNFTYGGGFVQDAIGSDKWYAYDANLTKDFERGAGISLWFAILSVTFSDGGRIWSRTVPWRHEAKTIIDVLLPPAVHAGCSLGSVRKFVADRWILRFDDGKYHLLHREPCG